MKKEDIEQLISQDEYMVKCLRTVRKLNLPDCWISAGFVRAKVWDRLHQFTKRTETDDVDVIYYDPITSRSRLKSRSNRNCTPPVRMSLGLSKTKRVCIRLTVQTRMNHRSMLSANILKPLLPLW